jgi:NTP pyrophosphatase (non-canonical NTP hydrolase)
MQFSDLVQKARGVRELYARLEVKKYGRAWTREEVVQGFVGDVGDLVKLTMAKNGARQAEKVDEKLKHELADCLWSVLVIADQYGIDLETAFQKNMDELEQQITGEL